MSDLQIKALIVDDESLARRRIRAMIRSRSDVVILGECSNGREALDSIDKLSPDLVLLDLEMPHINGLEVMKRTNADRPVFIFVTAHAEHGLAAFEADVVDYLLKPFDQLRFGTAIDRAKSRIFGPDPEICAHELREVPSVLAKEINYVKQIAIRTSTSIIPLKVKQIDWIEADRNYVRIFAGDVSYLKRNSLGSIERQLDPENFRRINRSVIVNIDRIQELRLPANGGEYEIVLRSGKSLILSLSYRDNLAQFLA